MTSPLEELNATEVGERLRIARETAKITQAQAAEAIGAVRTTLVAIEQGQRRLRMDELQKLARLYRTSVNALLRKEAIHVDLIPRFRKLTGHHGGAVDDAARLLSDLARAEVELENLLGIKRARNYPPERPLLPGDVKVQAEQDALELRQRLGLGLTPIKDIISLMEIDMGIRVYIRKLPAEISGLLAFDETLGACVLLNANHRRDRRTNTAAHEIGHLGNRREVEVLEDGTAENSREERYANSFARGFLTPARAVMQQFKEFTAGSDRLSRRHVILLANHFGVAREAIVRRLEELELVKPGAWEWFERNGNITDEQERQVLGELGRQDPRKFEAERPTTIRLNLLANAAWRQGLLTEAQLARLLRLDRVELREILDDGAEGSEGDAAPQLLA